MYQKISLESNRNKVERIFENNTSTICKTFTNLHDLYNEYDALCFLKQNDLNVPEVKDINGNRLMLQDLGDNTLLNWYENEEHNNSHNYEEVIYKLCSWLKKFYDIYKLPNSQSVLLDVNFNNFIIYNGEIYGIDFEHIRHGRIEEDAGRLVAYALTYEPEDTQWKMTFSTKLVDMLSTELDIDSKIINKEFKKELIAMKERRNQLKNHP